MADTIVAEADLAQYLGLDTATPIALLPPGRARLARAVNIRTLVTGGTTFATVRDLERALRSFADANERVGALLHSVADQISQASNLVPQRGDDLSP